MDFSKILILWIGLISSAYGEGLAPGTYRLDSAHSVIQFEINNFAVASVTGFFHSFEGSVEIANPLEQSKVTTKIQTDSIDTDLQARDKHLKSEDFFLVSQFPTMTFKSTNIEGKADPAFQMQGDLTIRGVTKAVTLQCKLKEVSSDGKKFEIEATGTLLRKDFGITYGPLVGNEVRIKLKIQAIKP